MQEGGILLKFLQGVIAKFIEWGRWISGMFCQFYDNMPVSECQTLESDLLFMLKNIFS